MLNFFARTDKEKEEHYEELDLLRMILASLGIPIVLGAFNRQTALVVEAIRREASDAVLNEVFSEAAPLMEQAMEKVYVQTAEQFGVHVLEDFARRGFNPEVDLNEVGQQFARIDGANLVVGINARTRQDLLAILSMRQRENWSQMELARQIEDRMAEIGRTRALRIARTETLRMSSYVNRATALQLGVPLVKTWMATRDPVTRDTHREADGQSAPLDVPYLIGGYQAQFPHDPALPAHEIVNCRCTETYQVRQDTP